MKRSDWTEIVLYTIAFTIIVILLGLLIAKLIVDSSNTHPKEPIKTETIETVQPAEVRLIIEVKIIDSTESEIGCETEVIETDELSLQTVSEPIIFDSDAELLAKLLYGECRGVRTTKEKAAVAWCVLNRVDAGYFGDSIRSVVTAPDQFQGYNPSNPILDELLYISNDVLSRWRSGSNEGRVLPEEYLYFYGDGIANHFTIEYNGHERYDWSLPDPYV